MSSRTISAPAFSDNMVLQRDLAAPVWGWTTPGQRVTVTMSGKTATAVADTTGKWMARIGPFAAGGPHTLTISGPQTVTLNNVMTGDVWICSGQSNMEQGIGVSANPQEEIANANHPNLRLFTVPKRIGTVPQSLVVGSWQPTTSQTIASGGWGGFSAVAYYFGRELHNTLKVPIGLIHTSWGGTVAEAWASAEALDKMPDFRPSLAQLQEFNRVREQGTFDYDRQADQWAAANDRGVRDGANWAADTLDMTEWKAMTLPQPWEAAGLPDFDGSGVVSPRVRFARRLGRQRLDAESGPIDDRDTTWINGTKIGATNEYNAPRNYRVAANLLKPGRNVLAVRVLDTGGGGGFYAKPEDMKLQITGDNATAPLSLAGEWRYLVSAPLVGLQPPPSRFDNNPNGVSVLYNGMIAPLVPFGIKGAIWYQGEANAGRAQQYRTLLPT
jgi:sialate O-acetylesterase